MTHFIDEGKKRILRENIALQRGFSSKKKYNLTFIGSGNIPEEAIKAISFKSDEFLFPINTINTFSRNTKGKTEKFEIALRHASQNGQKHITNIVRPYEDLKEILQPESTDLAFVTIDGNSPSEYNRSKLTSNNIKILEQMYSYFPDEIKTNINIISNIPEIIAADMSSQLNFLDTRLLTANVPLDVMRARAFATHEIYKNLSKKEQNMIRNTHICLSGHHCDMYPILEQSYIETVLQNIETGDFERKNLLAFIEQQTDINPSQLTYGIKQYIDNCAKEEFELEKRYLDEFNLPQTKGTTVYPTAISTYLFAKSFINHEKTITGILKEFNNTWYFTNLPVDLGAGYAKEDEERTKRYSQDTHEQIKTRIIGFEGINTGSLRDLTEETETEIGRKIKAKAPNTSLVPLKNLVGQGIRQEYTYMDSNTIQDLEKKDLETHINEQLNFEIGFCSKERPNELYRINVTSLDDINSKRIHPEVQNLPFSEKVYEESRLEIITLKIFNQELIGLIQRNRKRNSNTSRIDRFKEDTTQNIHFLESEHEKIQDFTLLNNILFTVNFKDNQFSIYQNNINNKILIYQTNDEIKGIESFNSQLLMIKEDGIYSFENKNMKKIMDSTTPISRYVYDSQTKIIGNVNRNSVEFMDLEQQKSTHMTTEQKLTDLVSENGNIQILTKENEKIKINNFHSKKNLIQQKGEYYFLESQIITNADLNILPQKNFLLSITEPNKTYLTYHDKKQTKIKKINQIKDINTLVRYKK